MELVHCYRCNQPICYMISHGPQGAHYCFPCKELEEAEEEARQHDADASQGEESPNE